MQLATFTSLIAFRPLAPGNFTSVERLVTVRGPNSPARHAAIFAALPPLPPLRQYNPRSTLSDATFSYPLLPLLFDSSNLRPLEAVLPDDEIGSGTILAVVKKTDPTIRLVNNDGPPSKFEQNLQEIG
jgi:hypothetical protein